MAQIREILVLHHSHLDVGYTHSQPIIWEMQREFIDQALALLEDTAGFPEPSRPKWTCEVTGPLLHWLDGAGDPDVDRFRAFVRQGRIGISAMQYNTTSLSSAELLCRQLAPARELRGRLGARISTAIQHDVNGVPWPLADLLMDAGVELLLMGVNIDHGHAVRPRPGVFLWEAPSGRRLLVMNGNTYTMFDQILRTWDNSISSMQAGLAEYVAHLEALKYPHDFLYLTTTNPPEAWDNSPPNPWVAELIREWNEKVKDPLIRYVTPEELLARLRRIPASSLPELRGDWTDYWTFGNGASACETSVSRQARLSLEAAEMLQALCPDLPGAHLKRARKEAWEKLSLYCEHTWTYWDPAPENPPTRAQSQLKGAFAHEARELAEYLLIDQLEALAGNSSQSGRPDQLLIVNPTSRARSVSVRLPGAWLAPGKRLRVQRFAWLSQREGRERGRAFGPVELPPFGWKRIPISALAPAGTSSSVRLFDESGTEAVIESPFHTLRYDKSTGRVLGLRDKARAWDVLARGGGHGERSFFEPVRERPDPSVDGSRNAIYERDLEKEKLDKDCWKPEWKAERLGPERLLSCTATRDEDSVTLVRELSVPGLDLVRQRITLSSETDGIELEATLYKQDHAGPEALYFAFPLNLPAGWNGHFDTAGVPVELDAEQLPESCRGWMSVDTFAALHSESLCAALVCRDSTLVQPCGFSFGRILRSVPRPAGPLLLAWPLNNYWNTNYPLSQPGIIRLRWGFLTSGAYEAADLMTRARELLQPPIAHPAAGAPGEGRFLFVEGGGVLVNHVKTAADGGGILVRLVNVGDRDSVVRLRPGGFRLRSAWLCGTLEDDRSPLPIVDGMAEMTLSPRLLTLVRLGGA